jgi:hypothetical protein
MATGAYAGRALKLSGVGSRLPTMTLDDLLDLVRASEPADWSMLTPITLNRVRLYGDDVPEVSLEGHQYVAHYRRDLDIALAWGAEQHDGKPWEGAWGEWSHFPDRKVYGQWAEILWRGRPVHRELIAAADGGRVYLPAPDPQVESDDLRAPITAWTVPASKIRLPRLLHGLVHTTSSFDSAFETAGFQVIGD